MIRIELDMSEVEKRFNRYNRKFKTKKFFVESVIRPSVQRELKLNFLGEGRPAPGRNRWAELSDSRKKQRALKGIGAAHPILRDTGELMQDVISNPSITYRGDKIYISSTESGKNVTKLRALHFGRPKSVINAFGKITTKQSGTTKIGKGIGILPTRPIMFISVQAWKGIVRKAKNYFFR